MMVRVSRLGMLTVLCGFSVILVGCGSGYPPLAPVTGTVTYKGEPLANATVVFMPTGSRISRGVTDDRGKYELTYIDDVKGAVLGKHQVQITTRQVDESDNETVKEKLPAKYHMQSTLTADVEYGGEPIDFKLD